VVDFKKTENNKEELRIIKRKTINKELC